MSGIRGGGGGGGKGTSNGGSIPQSSKKMIQSLKEIVNCPEAEIYAALKDCNMDPNETVNRLLSQDSFQEVKTKREKKKETKDATDSRSRGVSNASNRGNRSGNGRYGQTILSQFTSSESGGLRTKPSNRKDNSATITSSSSEAGVMGNNINWRSIGCSETPDESKAATTSSSENVLSLHQSAALQSPWSGVPRPKSMADIVKMGIPHARRSSYVAQHHQAAAHHHHHHVDAFHFAPTPHELYSSQNTAAKVSEVDVDLGPNVPNVRDVQDEKLSNMSAPLVSELSAVSERYSDPSRQPFNKTNHHLDKVQCVEDAEPDSRSMELPNGSSCSVPILNAADSYDSIVSYQVHRHAYEQQEDKTEADDVGVSLSSLSTSIHQVSVSEEEDEEEEEEDNDSSSHEIDSPAVKIPGYLQVQSAQCSHLSFGSFESGMGAPLSGHFATRPSKLDETETSSTSNAQSVGHTDARNSECYDDEHPRTALGGNSDHRLDVSSKSYNMPSASQSEMLKQEANEVFLAPGNEYSFPTSSPDYTLENSQHLNHSNSHPQISSQMQNLPQLSGIMSYTNSLPSSLLPSNTNHTRDAELSYSPFPITQSMPTNFGSNAAASLNETSGNTNEALMSGNLMSPLLTQNSSGSGISGGLAFPQQLPMHPYSQPSLPFANMVTYPFLPQNNAYMPSGFQQAISAAGNTNYPRSLSAAGNSNYPHSLSAGMLPQYKNNVSASSLPQSASAPSGYGPFWNSSSIPGNFSLTPPPTVASPASSMNYEDLLSSHYRDAAHVIALQQFQGLGSRTIPAVPENTYYSNQGQSHHQSAVGYRQSQQQQQPKHQYGNHLASYPNFYQSQNGVLQEHQQQMSREGSGSQGQHQSKQSQLIWQNSY